MKKIALHWQILIGMLAGVLFGVLAASMNWNQFVTDWIKPFGTIFINLLKLIAIPLIVASLVKGIADLQDISKLSKMGTRTIGIYLVTTTVAIVLGLLLVNIIKPGKLIEADTQTELMEAYGGDASSRIAQAEAQKGRGPLQPLVDIIPDNIFGAATDNGNMLQVISSSFSLALVLFSFQPIKPNPSGSFSMA